MRVPMGSFVPEALRSMPTVDRCSMSMTAALSLTPIVPARELDKKLAFRLAVAEDEVCARVHA